VAKYLKDERDEVPGTTDKDNIVGALHPLAMRDGARDNFYSALGAKTEIQSGQDLNATTLENIGAGGSFQFRDGDHSGEAPLEEIVDGFDSGELSEQCEIYNVKTDEWQNINSFLEGLKSRADCQIEDHTESVPQCVDKHVYDAAQSLEADPEDDFLLLDKNNQKRPQRDSSTWGKGQVLSLRPTLGVEERRSESTRHVKPPAKLMRQVTQAMIQWDMLQDGDRLLLGLSGGKDSLSLLHILLEFKKKLPIQFEIEVNS
jgi:hypothetical protein